MIHMRDKRAIIIKSTRLQKIRNNLRNLILQAYNTQWQQLFDEMEEIERDSTGKYRSVRSMTPDERKKFRELQRQETALRDLAGRSILMCVACGKGERDMIYNKAYNAWYCTECYGLERLTALKRAKARRKGTESCEEKIIEGHSKTFL